MAVPPRSTASAIDLPPDEAIAFLRQKTNTTSEHWTDLWQEAHSRGFTVAGATTQALVGDFRAAVAKALEQGTTLAEFRKDFDAIVEKHGWVHNGTPGWRAQIIYETNLSMAYSAGRYAQMTEPDTLLVYPYWQYQHTSSAHPRPQHLAWVGTTLRADDPWWSSHYPPNGWRCRCSVRPVSAAGLRRQGKDGPDPAPPVTLRPWRNPRTGQVIEVPAGIDPGFGYNPGAAWLGQPPSASAAPQPPMIPPTPAAPRLPSAAAVRPTEASAEEIDRLLRNPERASIPVELGELREDIPAAIGAETGRVVLSPETLRKQLREHPELTAADYALIPRILASPDAVYNDKGQHAVLLRWEGKLWRLVVKATRSGRAVFVQSFRRGNRRDAAKAGLQWRPNEPDDGEE